VFHTVTLDETDGKCIEQLTGERKHVTLETQVGVPTSGRVYFQRPSLAAHAEPLKETVIPGSPTILDSIFSH